MSKYCPILILTSVIGRTFGNAGSCYVVMEDKCIKEACALWNEQKNRCGLACTSQPEQPSRQPLSANQIQLAKMMPVMLVNLKTGDNKIGFLEGVAEEGTGINECREIAKFWWYCMDFANEYRMEEYGKTWVMYPYYPVSPIGI